MLTNEQRMIPLWNTNIVYGESLTMLKDEKGIAKAPLLYTPEKILSVTNAEETVEYKEGKDWLYENGYICIPPTSEIFVFEQDDIFLKNSLEGHSFQIKEGFLRFEEGNFFHKRQISVTYTCKKGQWTGIMPKYAGDLLPNTVFKIRKGGKLRIALYGDSISVGSNASRNNISPYQPNYFGLLCDELERRTGCKIEAENFSVGGKDSRWAVDNVGSLVVNHKYDLVIIAFGMNDVRCDPKEFSKNIQKIIETLKTSQPNLEFILIATSTPNPILNDQRAFFMGNQPYFKDALDKLVTEISQNGGIAVADITGMQRFLHSKKRFIDTTGNNVNHPNDFFHRCYAQFLVEMLLG